MTSAGLGSLSLPHSKQTQAEHSCHCPQPWYSSDIWADVGENTSRYCSRPERVQTRPVCGPQWPCLHRKWTHHKNGLHSDGNGRPLQGSSSASPTSKWTHFLPCWHSDYLRGLQSPCDLDSTICNTILFSQSWKHYQRSNVSNHMVCQRGEMTQNKDTF